MNAYNPDQMKCMGYERKILEFERIHSQRRRNKFPSFEEKKYQDLEKQFLRIERVAFRSSRVNI